MPNYKNDTIYIIYPGERPLTEDCNEWFSVKPFKEALLSRGYKVEVICFDDYTLEQFNELDIPAAVIFNHIITFHISQKYAGIIDFLKTWDTVFLNDINAQYITSNKIAMYSTLSNHGISVPKSIAVNGNAVIKNDIEFESTIQNTGITYPLVVKPSHGFRGRGTSLCNDYNDVVAAIDNVRSARYYYNRSLNYHVKSPAIIQEYIGEYPDMFIRVCMTPDHIGGYIFLVSPFEEVKFVNYNKHKFRVLCKVEAELESLVRDTFSALKVNAGCCDVLIDSNGYKITDVNCYGNLGLYIMLSGVNLFENMADYLDSKIKEKQT
jgi:glutathione synthase/RimK-type ligase-like ATP-grasp enzyme